MESLKGLRILVVEDDQDCAELFKFIFEDAGARVITVEKAGESSWTGEVDTLRPRRAKILASRGFQ